MVDIEAKGSGPLGVGNYIQFGRSHESDFHRITRFGSKICHRSVTGVTCDTRVAVCDSAPSFGPSPQRPKTRRIFTGKGTPQSTESPASLDRPIEAIFECLIGSKRPVYQSQLQYSVKVATSSYTVQLKYVLVYTQVDL